MPVTYRVGVDIGGTFTDIVLLGSDGSVHVKKIASSVGNYAQAIVDGLAEVFRETGLRRERGRGNPPRHHRRLERDPRAQGRARRPDHHQGLPRRAGNPHAAHAEALRSRLDQAGAAGRALSAQGGRRAHQPSRRGRAAARCRRRRARGRCAACREGRGDRGVPDQLVHQSGARADAEGHHPAQGAALAAQHLVRGAARDQGIRAHLDDGHQCLRDADRRDLSARAAQGPGRGRHSGAAAADAIERRPDHRHGRRRAADEHHRVRDPPAAWSARMRSRAPRTSTRSSPSTWAARPRRPR